MAQSPVGAADGPQKVSASEKEDLAPVPAKVDVSLSRVMKRSASGSQSALDATGWFTDPRVEVRGGVVFLIGLGLSSGLERIVDTPARLYPLSPFFLFGC